MPFLLLGLLLLLLVLGPGMWARWVLRRHAAPRADYPGTGGELARHLLDRHGLGAVPVEITESGDHYDPTDKTVRLSADNYHGKSLTSVAVAAHEVGHALQDQAGYRPLRLRTDMARWAHRAQRIGSWLFVAVPLVALLTRMPHTGGLLLLAGLLSFGVAVLIHLVTLPVEFDASFGRALPLLAEGYIAPQDQGRARHVLAACAMTYVAAALADILNLGRWLTLLRR
ncbi:MAG: zinc metallopeptidase [Gammaproteobacteria bacterium]|nr:zinc metallopeptidase [Gammaproteobacteria bacterium]MDX5374959.1 zinc metallopeptidase [Gammaproteobacteria bacterium]